MTMIYTTRGDIVILAHDDERPTDEEWSWMLSQLSTDKYRASLVVTSGGGPTASQRLAVDKWHKDHGVNPPVAIVTTDPIARGIVKAIRVFGGNVRAYSPAQIDKALDDLQVTVAIRQEILDELAEIGRDLGWPRELMEEVER